ncbi:tetratricopeptide repeat protein [Alphaproteobacteria bacterium LSUCC0719]
MRKIDGQTIANRVLQVFHGGVVVALRQQDISQLLSLFQQGKYGPVIKKALPLIRKHRGVPGLHELAGAALAATGDFARAERHLAEAVRLDPKRDIALHNLANLYYQSGQYDEAIRQFKALLNLRPADIDTIRKLGESCLKADMAQEAVSHFQFLVDRDDSNIDFWFLLGSAYRALKENVRAASCFERILSQNADHFEAIYSLGNICRDTNLSDEAIQFYERALHLRPNHISTMCNIGLCHINRHALDIAASWFQSAVDQDPQNPEPQYLKSLPHFLDGNVKAGFEAAEWRLRLKTQFKVMYDGPEPAWDGKASLDGKRLIVHAEQGFGDSIMMLRFINLLDPSTTRITVLVQRGLKNLFAESFDCIEFIEFTDDQAMRLVKRDRGDYQCSLMSLAHLMAPYWTSLPVAREYLRAPSAVSAKWAKQIPRTETKRIGLVWRGNPKHVNDHNRSIALQSLVPLLPTEHDYVALQKDISITERALFNAPTSPTIEMLELGDFADTAGLCSTLDAVVSVDTSVAHLAGALGLPTMVLLPHVPDWRWELSGSTTPWYPNMTLHRQPAAGDWMPALASLKNQLAQL